MFDWTKSMKQTFEYYIVDPGTWKDMKRLENVKSSTIKRDSTVDTLGSATIDVTESPGEAYVRIYLNAEDQNGNVERPCLGTFLVQTPSSSFNGLIKNISMDAYTPLLELTEDQPAIGYYTPKGQNIMDSVYRIFRDKMRGPVVKPNCDKTVFADFIADPNDTWLSYGRDLAASAKYEPILDELGRTLFAPKQDMNALQPVWTFNDDNSSILYPDISMDHDLYGIPNVVEVIYSNGNDYYYARVVNDDPNSPTSTVKRGREIVRRVTDPSVIGDPTKDQIQQYAEQLLRELSSIEYTISYKHGYCPVRVGDCVRLNYTRAGIVDVKAKVISQSIKCTSGCEVTETATFTKKLWE